MQTHMRSRIKVITLYYQAYEQFHFYAHAPEHHIRVLYEASICFKKSFIFSTTSVTTVLQFLSQIYVVQAFGRSNNLKTLKMPNICQIKHHNLVLSNRINAISNMLIVGCHFLMMLIARGTPLISSIPTSKSRKAADCEMCVFIRMHAE